MQKFSSSLVISALQLNLHLGWPDKERLKKQAIWLDVNISFSKSPKACLTDDITDTICYAMMVEAIKKHLARKKFRLVEHLAQEIYSVIKSLLPKKSLLNICITKYPNIKDLKGGIRFYFGDN